MRLGETVSEKWFQIYDCYLQKAHKHPISGNPDGLLPLAYSEIENHLNVDNLKTTNEPIQEIEDI